MYWPAPSFFISEPSEDRDWPPSEADPAIGTVAATDSNGLDLTLFIPAGYMLADHPDRLLEKPSPSSTPIPTFPTWWSLPAMACISAI
jgi:hypothetical protein